MTQPVVNVEINQLFVQVVNQLHKILNITMILIMNVSVNAQQILIYQVIIVTIVTQVLIVQHVMVQQLIAHHV